ncbi:MAG: restriction endonuclease [Betaproteobacteria bacterium]|nr:restriction endonuclease [Betaproteobacteria bacterium]
MKFEMAKNSLFAILLRSPWWVSLLVAAGMFLAVRLVLPEIYAFFVPLPFMVIAAYAGWQQLRAPSAARIAATLDAIRAMSWNDFSGAVEQALRREGYAVGRFGGPEADFELTRSGRTALLTCKRWRVARTGIEPLRDLHTAMRARDAHECIYVAAGEFSDNAQVFAQQMNIRLLHGTELVKLLPLAAG